MISIETESLTKVYGRKTVVESVSLSINTGEIFALLGPNGSGKSTIVKMLTGLLEPTRGAAKILGESAFTDNLEIKSKIGVLPESLALFDSLSIWEHVLLTGEVYGLTKTETAYRGEQLLKHLDLWENRATPAEACSYGMKKKCSLSLALIHNPLILFLDEPFEGIDPVSSRNIKNVLSMLTGRGCTIFITSHILEIMEQLVDSFAIISGGKIVYRAKIESLKSAGASLESVYLAQIENQMSGEIEWLGQ
jgi:ABC-2 type transport system ATP-binding protein